jgi:hypothetical protein
MQDAHDPYPAYSRDAVRSHSSHSTAANCISAAVAATTLLEKK